MTSIKRIGLSPAEETAGGLNAVIKGIAREAYALGD